MLKKSIDVCWHLLIIIVVANAQNDLISFDVWEKSHNVQTFDDVFPQVCSNFEDIINVSSACVDQLKVVCNYDNNDLLLTMLDASSKFPWTGIRHASLMDFGDYDECLEIDYSEEVDEKSVHILGKHCSAGFIIPISDKYYQPAICIPDKCSKEDFISLTGLYLFNIDDDVYCSTKETRTDYPSGEIAVLCVFGFFAAILIISTIYDIYLHTAAKKSPHPLLIAFSVLSNGRKLFRTSKGSREQVMNFHGLRFISLWWIAAGHTYSSWTAPPTMNPDKIDDFMNSMRAFYIMPAHIAVDTFFFISGFLLAYQYLKQKPRSLGRQVSNLPKLILHRYLRITPVVAMTYLFFLVVLRHMGSGPFFGIGYHKLRTACTTYWYSYFFYAQNYVNPDDLCITHTWYLSADMQLFVVAPIAMIPIALIIKKNFKKAMIIMLLLNILFTILAFFYVFFQDLWYNEYDSHTRLVDYWIGFMLGAYMREKKEKTFTISKKLNVIIWCIVLLDLLAVVVFHRYVELYGDYTVIQSYYALMRPLWCLGLSWVVFACHNGYGGFINWVLSNPLMQVGSKLSYCIYITHGLVIVYYVLVGRSKKHYSAYTAFYEWCGAILVAFVTGTIASLAFESPILILERYILGGGARHPPKHPATEQHNIPGKTPAQLA